MSRSEAAFCRSAPWRLFAARVVLPWALQGYRPEGRVLEIGAGSGAMAAALLRSCPQVSMVVTDVDDAMVAAAGDRLAPFGDRVEVQRADSCALPFEDASFDAVLSWLMLHHTIQWESALAEAFRVLRPGGWLVAYDVLSNRPTRRIHQLEGSTHRLMRLPELRATLDALPCDSVSVRPFAGLLVRFRARRAQT